MGVGEENREMCVYLGFFLYIQQRRHVCARARSEIRTHTPPRTGLLSCAEKETLGAILEFSTVCSFFFLKYVNIREQIPFIIK